jgi:hypothetical protein
MGCNNPQIVWRSYFGGIKRYTHEEGNQENVNYTDRENDFFLHITR